MEYLVFPNFDPVALQLGPLVIRWYALAYVGGILLGYGLLVRLEKRLPFFSVAARDDIVLYAVLGIVLGGRLGFVLFYHPLYFLENPTAIFAVWQGGMSFHGGILGVLLSFVFFARKHQLPWLGVMDRLALVTPIGLFLGRLANFVNGELYGRVTDVSWGMVFPNGGPLPRHPSQLYEAFGEGLILFVLLYLLVRYFHGFAYRGRIGGVFLAGYGVARFTVEFFREPDANLGFLFADTTMGQLLCVPMVLGGLWLVAKSKRALA
jgi:phosphatidylglycerol:prolipoprotein diacylglycerol transferase